MDINDAILAIDANGLPDMPVFMATFQEENDAVLIARLLLRVNLAGIQAAAENDAEEMTLRSSQFGAVIRALSHQELIYVAASAMELYQGLWKLVTTRFTSDELRELAEENGFTQPTK